MNEMTPEAALALRKPFPKESIGKLPKGGAMLDYVGHAAVTDRLLTVDPGWTWEPFALTPEGLPMPDHQANLWIRLTVCGVTRIGVGDGKNAKERIGDAIRNAAMRFGVALDLWAKEDLVEFAQAARSHQTSPAPGAATPVEPPAPPAPSAADEGDPTGPASAGEPPMLDTRGKLAKAMFAALGKAGISDKDDRLAYIEATIGRAVSSSAEMTDADARTVLDALARLERGDQ